MFTKTLIMSDPCDIRKIKWFQKLGFFRTDFINVFDDPKKNYERIIRNDYDILVGYPIDLKMMAKMVIDNKKFVKPKVVFSSAELLDQETRSSVEKAFNAPVCDYYGSTEGGCVAFQTPGLDGYHIPMDIAYLEITHERKVIPFEETDFGEAIITNLWNLTHPVIRYNIGDFIEVKSSSHDKAKTNFPMIKGIVGKYLDFLVFENDVIISPHKVKQLLTDLKGVEAFQVYQDVIDTIKVRIVLEDDGDLEAITQLVVSKIKHILPKKVNLKIEQVQQFERKASKKFKVIESIIGQKYFESRKLKMMAPGPVNTAEGLYDSLSKYEIGHRGNSFETLFKETTKNLSKVFHANELGYTSLLVSGSATCANETVLFSLNKLFQKTLIISNGEFGERLARQASLYGHTIMHKQYEWGLEIDINEIEDILQTDNFGLVIMVALETSTGMINPIKKISEIIKKGNNETLLFIDAVSAFGAEDIDIEDSKIDFCTASAGKAIGALPGLSMICMNKDCIKYIEHLRDEVGYLNLYRIYKFALELNQTPHTPAIQLIAALNYALKLYLKKGEKEIKEHYRRCFQIIDDGMDEIGIERLFERKDLMSKVVSSYILPENIEFDFLKDALHKKGFLIYGGKKYLKEKRVFQVAVMGELTEENCFEFIKKFKEIINR